MSIQTEPAFPLATDTWDDRERIAVAEIMASRRHTMGARVQAFEAEFARWTGSRYAVMVNSGSSANLIAVGAHFYKKQGSLRPGDEVIVPAVSWSTTFFPLTQYGIVQVFIDIDRATLNLDLDKVADAITDKTRAIFAVNLLGNPVDYDRLTRIIDGRPIVILEDNCESMGASLNGRKAGTFGSIGTHSTFYSHHMSTIEGGVAVTDDLELYQIMLTLRAHGWLRNLPEKNLVCDKLGDQFQDSFRFALPGYCLRPTEIQGALGSVQLTKLDDFVARRRQNAVQFRERFGRRKEFKLQSETGESSWFGFSLVLEESAPYSRAELAKTLQLYGVECRPIVAGDFTQNPCIAYMPHRVHGDLVNAAYIHKQGLFVGNNPQDLTPSFDIFDRALESLY